MGYAIYETPLGDAGYAVEDTCHAEGCDEAIDRGLDFLCGSQPGRSSEFGCGRWFCGRHLFCAPEPVIGGGVCEACLDAWEAEHGPQLVGDVELPEQPDLPEGGRS